MTAPTRETAARPPSRRDRGPRATSWSRTVLTAPVSPRAAREFAFCALGVAFVAVIMTLPFVVAGTAFIVDRAVHGSATQHSQPAVGTGFVIVMPILLAAFLAAATTIGRALGATHRAVARRLLGERIDGPAPRRAPRPGAPKIGALLGDGPGWRTLAYNLVKLPLAAIEIYAASWWVVGIVNITYPFWWRLFRNHPPGTQLSPVTAWTAFGPFQVSTFGGTFAAFGAGVAMLLAAPWLTRAVSRLDLAVMRPMLGPGRVAEQMRRLRDSRARAVDDAAELVRRLERDLHDGAQIRLATVAMHLGMASEKLGVDGPAPDLTQARELVAAAHRGAKDALAELRDLVRGIHPPVLDAGLPDALSTLASGCPIPVAVEANVTSRPAPAIETIAYFCAAELLTNAAKHSRAANIELHVATRDDMLTLRVCDDGGGGADPAHGSGLRGLQERISTVDGRIRISSPPGGPTDIAVELPLSA